jgi:ribosomal protein S6--L-glutamate ligase
MILSFHPCFDADFNVVLGSRRLNGEDFDLIEQAEAVIMPQGRPQDIYEVCSRADLRLFPNYDVRFRYPGKIGQSLLFEDLGLSHPETLRWSTVEEFKEAYPGNEVFPHALPFLIKDDKSHEAEGVFFVEDGSALSMALKFLAQRGRSGLPGFVSQAYIPSEGNVLRAVIIGKKIITYWKRPKESGQIITTISRGALVDREWRPDLQEKGNAAARVLAGKTGIDLAAVDFIFAVAETEPEALFLEINYYFGRRGLGGSENYYQLLYEAVRAWLGEEGQDPDAVRLV